MRSHCSLLTTFTQTAVLCSSSPKFKGPSRNIHKLYSAAFSPQRLLACSPSSVGVSIRGIQPTQDDALLLSLLFFFTALSTTAQSEQADVQTGPETPVSCVSLCEFVCVSVCVWLH